MKTFKNFMSEDAGYDKFKKLWKARPIWTAAYSAKAWREFHLAEREYFRKHFGGKEIWTDKFMQRYWTAVDRGSMTYKKQRYPMTHGMDQGDFVWDVYNGISK